MFENENSIPLYTHKSKGTRCQRFSKKGSAIVILVTGTDEELNP